MSTDNLFGPWTRLATVLTTGNDVSSIDWGQDSTSLHLTIHFTSSVTCGTPVFSSSSWPASVRRRAPQTLRTAVLSSFSLRAAARATSTTFAPLSSISPRSKRASRMTSSRPTPPTQPCLLSHPNNTLWDYFKIERKQKKEMNKNLPLKQRIKNAFTGFVDYTADTVIAMAQTLADAIEWIINTIRNPLVGVKQVATFFKDFGTNIKALWGLMKEDPKETAENMGGGLLLHITHHPSEFTAETVLMIGVGFAVIGGLMAGVEAVFGTMSNVISNVLLSVLMFIHALDDPIYIVTPLVTSIVNTAGELANGGNSTADSTVVTVDAIQPLESCQIPPEYRPVFSSRDLCLSSPEQVRQLIFGTFKRTAKMNSLERIAAYNHFHDFVCCYLENQEFEVNAPKTDATAFESELVSTPVKMTNCSQLLGTYSAATVWKSANSTDGTTTLSGAPTKAALRRG